MTDENAKISFIIGEEKRLDEIIGRAEIEPLLRSALKAGLIRAAVLDEDGLPLCALGEDAAFCQAALISHPLQVEGEPRGLLTVAGNPDNPATTALALLLRDVLQLTLNSNLKRMLTTEVHTNVVQESYEQLVAANRSLTESEARYRTLATTMELKVEERTAELQKAYARMLQQEKLASIGQLAAGMAHEINNPTGFILSNLTTFGKYAGRQKEMLELFRDLLSTETTLEDLRARTEVRWRELKLDFILADTKELLVQSVNGAERIKNIISDLKSFSHVDESDSGDVDLNAELERTLSVARPLMLTDTTVIREYTPLPPFHCTAALLCQAFLAIIENSLKSCSQGLVLTLATRYETQNILISITDNGCGIAPQHLKRVFDPFFTTREVGSGTGMGLTVAREIVAACGGDIVIESTEGVGTTVSVRLPLPTGDTHGSLR